MVRMLVMDVDGTLTDGKIYMGADGELMKAFDIKDGYAIYSLLPAHGILPVIITGRRSGIVEKRCAELGITELHQGCLDKAARMREIALAHGIAVAEYGKIEDCAVIGDDLLDLPAMKLAGVSGCPADAVPEVRTQADHICEKKGGEGAVREFVEWIIKNSL